VGIGDTISSAASRVRTGLRGSVRAATSAGKQAIRGDLEGAIRTGAQDPYIASFAGALTGNYLAQPLGVSSGGLGSLNAAGMSSPTQATATGAATGYEVSQMLAPQSSVSASAPPDVNEKNDPATAQQFLRIRKAARMLGRAGTIKYKGTDSLGGDGGNLGTSMGVTG
jgi:hypothetical protein